MMWTSLNEVKNFLKIKNLIFGDKYFFVITEFF
jgi:effector-binding domain-containing protein